VSIAAPTLVRPLAARTGELILTGGITPHADDGRLVRGMDDVSRAAAAARTSRMLVDVRTERALAQAWRIYERLGEALAGHGAGFEQLLRQRIFVRDRRDIEPIERAMDRFLGGVRPPTSVVEMDAEGLHPEIDVQLDAIAVDPASGPARELIGVDDASAAAYAVGARSGQLLFVSGVVGVNPATGLPAGRIGELGDEARSLAGLRLVRDRDERIAAQMWFICKRLEQLLGEHGSSLGGIVKLNAWLTFGIRDYAPVIDVRDMFFRDGVPASTALRIGGVLPDGAELSVDVIALIPVEGGRVKEEPAPSAIGSFYVDVVSVGDLIVTCGEVPIDTDGPRLVASYEDLDLDDAEGRALGSGVIHAESGTQARGWYVYRRLERDLRACGAGFGDVVQQTVYLRRIEEFPAVERLAARLFPGGLPPTTVVPIADTSPFYEAGLEIDMIAQRGGLAHRRRMSP
jgi:enamine deaminase RidA (YjgF/YER057c/UK114 family)